MSVVLVVLDAAGARHLGAYGNPRLASPNIDALVRDGAVLFERAYAQSAWTLPSTASLLTGRYPPRRRQARLVVDGETVATVLHDSGFRTAAFSENPFVTAQFGFARGFDVFHEYFPQSLLQASPRSYGVESARTTTDALAWLREETQLRVLLVLHLLTPHAPYLPPAPFAGRFDPHYPGDLEGTTDTLLRINEGSLQPSTRDLEHLRLSYQENLAFGDHQVGRLVEELRRTGRLDRTILVVTADHGEAFREHGVMLHTTTVYEEMIHVPLVVRFPPRFGRLPARWPGVVELRDLVPTICDALRVPCSVGTSRSLLRLLRSPSPPARVARAWTSDGAGIVLGALVAQRWKLVMDVAGHRLALYDLAADPHELGDLSAHEPVRARRLARRLRAPGPSVTLGPGGGTVSEDLGRRLRALGYVQY